MKNKIEIKNLTKHYGGFTLDNVSFSVPRGSVVGLIGENGAGKSTIIKSLLGVINTDGGEILFDGVPLGRLGKNQRQLTGVVLDDVSLPSAVNLRELNTVMKNMFSRWDEQTFFALTERFRLPRDKKTGEFSKGMKMKTAIAAALSHGAETLILDEPTSGLDPVARDEILDILYDFMQNSGHAVLISSHITSDLENCATMWCLSMAAKWRSAAKRTPCWKNTPCTAEIYPTLTPPPLCVCAGAITAPTPW